MVLTNTTVGMVAHIICEISSTIESFLVNGATGALVLRVGIVSTLPATVEGSHKASEILRSADGRFVYASTRGNVNGSSATAVFAVDQGSGSLSPVQFVPSNGSYPRGMVLIGALGAPRLLVGG